VKCSIAALRSLAAAALVAVSLGACDSGTEVGGIEIYQLVSVNEQPLPAPYPHPEAPEGVVQVSQGELRLLANGSFLMELYMRCHPNPPANIDCDIEGDARQPMVGLYSRVDGHIQFGNRQYPTTFQNNVVRVHIMIPPSEGLYPSFMLEFRR
jgi:hypothetical protein